MKKKSRMFSIPVLVVSGLVMVTCAFIGGLIVGNQIPGSATAAPDSLSGWVSALATLVVSILTIVLAIETWRLRAAQTQQIAELMQENIRPNVGIELISSHVGVHFFDVRVSNLGKGIAKKITFEFLDRNDDSVTEEAEPIVKVFCKLAMFRLGIQSMGINQKLKSFLFNFLTLGNELGTDIFKPFVNIRIRFEDIEGNEYFNAFVVDFAQYQGFSELGGNSLHQLAIEAKAIREHLVKAGSAGNRLAVNIFDSDDRGEEAEAQEEQIRQWREKHQQKQ